MYRNKNKTNGCGGDDDRDDDDDDDCDDGDDENDDNNDENGDVMLDDRSHNGTFTIVRWQPQVQSVFMK